jgi:hypothetical protein
MIHCRQLLDLSIDFSSIPLDATGIPLANATVMKWADLVAQNALIYVSKNQQSVDTQASLLPIVKSLQTSTPPEYGADGFGIVVSKLKQILPANGYSLQLPYRYILRTQDYSSLSSASTCTITGLPGPCDSMDTHHASNIHPLSVRRKLLQATTQSTSAVQGQYTIIIEVVGNAPDYVELNESNPNGVSTGTSVTYSLATYCLPATTS